MKPMEEFVNRMVSAPATKKEILFRSFISSEKKSFDIWWSWFLNNGIAKPDMPSVFCWLVWQGCAIQQGAQLTALRQALAVSILLNIALLVGALVV